MESVHFHHVLIDSVKPVFRGEDLFQLEPGVVFEMSYAVTVIARDTGLVYYQPDGLALQIAFGVGEKNIESGYDSVHRGAFF